MKFCKKITKEFCFNKYLNIYKDNSNDSLSQLNLTG